jgi:hypothetical protein
MKRTKSRNGFREAVVSLLVVAAIVAVSSGAFAANKLIVQDNTVPTAVDKFVVSDTGYTGIGTNAPGTALEILGYPGISSRILLRTDGLTSTAGGGGLIVLHNNALADNFGFPRLGDRLGFVLFGAKNGTANATGGGVSVYADGLWSATSWPTAFLFETAPVGSVNRSERMRISGSGNVGVNTKSPSQQLEVAGGVRLNPPAAIVAVTKPDCIGNSANVRGTLWFTQGAVGVADTFEVCAKDAAGNFDWRKIY